MTLRAEFEIASVMECLKHGILLVAVLGKRRVDSWPLFTELTSLGRLSARCVQQLL